MNFARTSATTGTNSRLGTRATVLATTMLLVGGAASGCGGMGGDVEPGAAADETATSTSAALTRVATDAVITKTPIKVVTVQLVSDLKPDGVMRFYSHDATHLGVQINVTNVGNMAAWAPAGSVTINGASWDGALHQYYGGSSQMANTVNPGERGYILVYVPNSLLAPCTRYTVHVDTGHNMQAGLPDPYANDEASVGTQCLSWTSTINQNNFTIAGAPLEGSSLGRVISSIDIGRTDGLRCSACHFQNAAGRTYQPPVAQNSNTRIGPTQVINGRTWTEAGGWADRFLQRPTDTSLGSKPYHLKALVQTWIDDGRNPGNQLLWNLDLDVGNLVFTAN